MDRVLKRVGLVRTKNQEEKPDEGMQRRRKRSNTRRKSDAGPKTRGLFNIDWESVRECGPCKSTAITRKFCNRKSDNELYRSNSFKFERFVRGNDEVNTLDKQVALLDEYSLPVDHVNKRRPNSIAVANFPEPEEVASPVEENTVEILLVYPTPRDFCQNENQEELDHKCFTSPDKEYSQPYSTDQSSEVTSDDDFFTLQQQVHKPEELNSPDSIAEGILPLLTVQSPETSNPKRHPSPYYYSDLYKTKPEEPPKPPVRQPQPQTSAPKAPKENSDPEGQHHRRRRVRTSRSRRDSSSSLVVSRNQWSCKCKEGSSKRNSVDFSHAEEHENVAGMMRKSSLYETAFDCRVDKSDDDLDQLDKVTNHSVLLEPPPPPPPPPPKKSEDINELMDALGGMNVEGELAKPSTAPLPPKFQGREQVISSIRSTPNLRREKPKLKHLPVPIHSMRGKSPTSSSGGSVFEVVIHDNKTFLKKQLSKQRVMEIKDRPRKKSAERLQLSDLTAPRLRHKYSSTESMTSSSGGSMESLKSSTSEGNRSTSSSGSRHSSSLSSHSSESGRRSSFHGSQSAVYLPQTSKHILSPISDKSSQEPISEMSDNNRNNNSQKCSPDELEVPENPKSKRRPPQNKNLLNLGGNKEIKGSDSGISMLSREGVQSSLEMNLSTPGNLEVGELPFDMPKLRRKRVIAQEACISSSATSVDVRELPFDIPKLRRKLKIQSHSQPSSSQSTEGDHPEGHFRPNLTLNLDPTNWKGKSDLGLPLAAKSEDAIDVSAPLERQGWYHGAITRVEAENVLRLLREGSFLVRNSESMKQDYSLSLKSARGFMHMRIQRDAATGAFILGEFSKPFTSIPIMIRHFSLNRLPIRGAEHMCLIQPVIAQLL